MGFNDGFRWFSKREKKNKPEVSSAIQTESDTDSYDSCNLSVDIDYIGGNAGVNNPSQYVGTSVDLPTRDTNTFNRQKSLSTSLKVNQKTAYKLEKKNEELNKKLEKAKTNMSVMQDQFSIKYKKQKTKTDAAKSRVTELEAKIALLETQLKTEKKETDRWRNLYLGAMQKIEDMMVKLTGSYGERAV